MKIPTNPPPIDEILKNESNRKELAEYFKRQDILEFTSKINERYLYWDEFRYRPHPKKTKPELLWALIKFTRNYEISTLKISSIEKFTFKYKTSEPLLHKLHEYDMNLGGSLVSKFIIPHEDKEKYLINSIMEESIASSQLEGASTTRKVAKEMLRTSRKPRNKSEKMIVNNYLTNKKILDLKTKKLTPEMILDIHAGMTKETLEDRSMEGKYRQTNDIHVIDNATNEICYTPPDFKLLPQLINDFCEYANNNNSTHPIIKAFILHFLIGYIHPFVDGNGRTARAIFFWYLLSRDYWLFEYLSISRIIIKSPAQYAKAYLYTEKDENDLTYFINYQVKTIDSAFKDLKLYIDNQIKEKEKTYELLKIDGINNRQLYLLRLFTENPNKTMTINELQNTFNVVYQTARTDLLDMVSLGFLDKKTLGKKKLLFLRSESFEKILNTHRNKK